MEHGEDELLLLESGGLKALKEVTPPLAVELLGFVREKVSGFVASRFAADGLRSTGEAFSEHGSRRFSGWPKRSR